MRFRFVSYSLIVVLCFVITVSASDPTQALDDIVGPDTYPVGVNPLTGLVVDDPQLLDRRPLLIKISNFPVFVRPFQSGLNDADLVWEHLLAGGVTRFSAIFLGSDPEKIGPIRSGRLLDFELTRIYRSLFAYSGMSQGTVDVLFEDDLVRQRVVGGAGPCPALCRFPEEGLALEHTLFSNTPALRELAVERGADVEPESVHGMAFTDDPPGQSMTLASMLVRYRQTEVQWVWDAETERWLRFQDGEPHMDMSRNTQVRATNVVVIEEEHTVQPFVRDQYWGPPNFAFSANFIGEGRIFLMRDGLYQEGVWRRATREDPLTFYDTNGQLLTFKPGNTFFNLVPRWVDGYELEIVPVDAPTVEVVGESGASMRFGPNNEYRSPDVAYPGDGFKVIGRNFDGDWLQLIRGDERAVWLPVERLDASGIDLTSLPIPRPTIER